MVRVNPPSRALNALFWLDLLCSSHLCVVVEVMRAVSAVLACVCFNVLHASRHLLLFFGLDDISKCTTCVHHTICSLDSGCAAYACALWPM